MWETTSDWNEDDDEAALEENELCFGVREAGLSNGRDHANGHHNHVANGFDHGGGVPQRMDLS